MRPCLFVNLPQETSHDGQNGHRSFRGVESIHCVCRPDVHDQRFLLFFKICRYIPDLGAEAIVYLEEHAEHLTFTVDDEEDDRKLFLHQRTTSPENIRWKELRIAVFKKVLVNVICKERPPIDIKASFVGPFGEVAE